MVQSHSDAHASDRTAAKPGKLFLLLIAILAAVLGFLFFKSFAPGQALFGNDGPLAVQCAPWFNMPSAFFGIWNDLYWLGQDTRNVPPNGSMLVRWALGPYGYTNFGVPIAFLIAGLCAAYFFRKLGFGTWVCVLGGIAAALNGNFFSNGCWGLPSRSMCLAMAFLALAGVQSSLGRWTWVKAVLAGLAIGLSISEGGDNGAFFSLFIAAYTFFVSFIAEPGSSGKRAFRGALRVAITAIFAAILAAQVLNVFSKIAVKGIVGTQQDAQTKQEGWIRATMWSTPKLETLRVIIPGLFGYRMDTPEGGNYWGAVGSHPDAPASRSSGSGEYAGVIVVLVAAWGVVESLRKKGSVFTDVQRKLVWFWAIAAFIALLFAWGRFAPFYKLLYSLPYFSTIRNPMKLMHPFHMVLMILFAYGLHGLGRRYLQGDKRPLDSFFEQARAWWKTADGAERAWTWGSAAFCAVSALGLLIYFGLRQDIARYLATVGFESEMASAIAGFSIKEVAIYLVVLLISAAAVFAVQTGFFRGARMTWAAAIIGLILIVDLARANVPWIQYYNYRERYASNPVIDVLKDKPYTHRTTMIPLRVGGQAEQYQAFLNNVYRGEWLQHHFEFYAIHSIDVSQMPRVPEDYAAFNRALGGTPLRLWQVTNTRYMLSMAGATDVLNNQLDPIEKRFTNAVLFTLEGKGGYPVAVVTTNGPFALVEYKGALPRARLYQQWQVETNDAAALAKLASPTFDPAREVILAGAPPIAPSTSTNAAAGTVEFKSYEPKQIVLKTSAQSPSIMLLNDRYDPSWLVTVDGQPVALQRCNYIARGVAVPAGDHEVRFVFKPSLTGLWVTAGAEGLGLALCGFLVLVGRRSSDKT